MSDDKLVEALSTTLRRLTLTEGLIDGEHDWHAAARECLRQMRWARETALRPGDGERLEINSDPLTLAPLEWQR